MNFKEIYETAAKNPVILLDYNTYFISRSSFMGSPQRLNAQYTLDFYNHICRYGAPIKLFVPLDRNRITSKTALKFSDNFKNNSFMKIPVKTLPINEFIELSDIVIQTQDSYYLMRIQNYVI